MNYAKIIICIAIMAAVTYLPRMVPLAFFKKKITNRYVRSFLAYVPYAALAAMTIPEVFYSTGNVITAAVGAAIAFLLGWLDRGLLVVALGGAGAVFLTELLLQNCFPALL